MFFSVHIPYFQHCRYIFLIMPMCAAIGCFQREKSSGPHFFRFPQDPFLRTRWLKAIGRPDLNPKNQRICDHHFDPSLIFKYGQRVRLVTGAVPGIFNHVSPLLDHSYPIVPENARQQPPKKRAATDSIFNAEKENLELKL